MTESSQIVQKLWNYCNVLRDDGMSYGDYVEQLTYLSVKRCQEQLFFLPSPRLLSHILPRSGRHARA